MFQSCLLICPGRGGEGPYPTMHWERTHPPRKDQPGKIRQEGWVRMEGPHRKEGPSHPGRVNINYRTTLLKHSSGGVKRRLTISNCSRTSYLSPLNQFHCRHWISDWYREFVMNSIHLNNKYKNKNTQNH